MALALDTESSYDAGRDIRSLGVEQYVRHPQTDHYLVSLYEEGFEWVGPPSNCPWGRLQGATLLSHNAAYDQSVVAQLRHAGLPIPEPAAWHCTANLAAYHQVPRSLAGAAETLLGETVDKSVRDQMRGRNWASLDQSEKTQVTEYALSDAKTCHLLWQRHGAAWPAGELAVSDHTALMCRRGIAVDLTKLAEGIEILRQVRFDLEQQIPWAGELNEKGAEVAVTSPRAVTRECRRLGIPPPTSTDVKSPEWEAWADTHAAAAPFVAAIQQWRRANRLLAVLETMQQRQVDGILSYGLKYFGASHTGRWSGDQGLNMQNFPRHPFNSVDARGCLIPRPGMVFVLADFAQIEARVALWLAQAKGMLNLLHAGVDLYEAHARQTMNYCDPRPLKEVNPDMRQFAKCRVLGLGFGLGPIKFQQIVKQWSGQEITLAKAKQVVRDFRCTNPRITALWRRLEQGLRQSAGDKLAVELPSGRAVNYFNIAQIDGQWTGRVERGGPPKKLYGGLLFENLVQATARDLFAESILRLESAGLPVVLHVHDEVVVEVTEADGARARDEVERLMRQVPPWAEGLPVEVKAHTARRFMK